MCEYGKQQAANKTFEGTIAGKVGMFLAGMILMSCCLAWIAEICIKY
jgi:hypothetical protein